jgi:protein-tyrosine phosphatase
MKIIDFHSHFLPGIDDGSRNLEISTEILSISKNNGVDVMVATPHFYADEHRVDVFVKNRQAAYEQVIDACHGEAPELVLGAEVAYFENMGKAERISDLTIGDTNNILLEMPFRQWRKDDIEEIRYMIYERGFHVIIAHLERYLNIPGNKKMISYVTELPVSIQVNAESIIDKKLQKTILKNIKKGYVQLLGSDCHGIHRRPPNVWLARNIIEDKLGAEFLSRIDEEGNRLLNI